jgi:hypothetical protein
VSTARERPRAIATASPAPAVHTLAPLLLTAAVLLLTAMLAACAPADRLAAPPAPSAAIHPEGGAPVEVTRQRLERAAGDLLYTSESDHPFTYVFRAGPFTAPLDVATFRLAFGVPADVPVEQVGLDDFFARHIERVDPADEVAVALVPRYRRLRETLRHTLREPRVFRVGRIAIDCEIVGTDAAGNVVGLHTLAVET